MLYSKTAKYAVIALSEIARHRPVGEPVATRGIAESGGIPYALLAKIIVQLRRAGLVTALRGKQGGVSLARPPERITIRDVVEAIDGNSLFEDCPLYLEPCQCRRECSLHPLWKPARDAVVSFLEQSTIADVAEARGDLTALPDE